MLIEILDHGQQVYLIDFCSLKYVKCNLNLIRLMKYYNY